MVSSVDRLSSLVAKYRIDVSHPFDVVPPLLFLTDRLHSVV